MANIEIGKLTSRLNELGNIGRDRHGRLMRLAASHEDKLGRDKLLHWFHEAGLDVEIDEIGNIFGLWRTAENRSEDSIIMGSHIDSVVNAGIYDGCYGVLAGLSVIEALRSSGFVPARPIGVVAFTNEEGVRYAPTMMGSLVFAGLMSLEEAYNTVGIDGTTLGTQLREIGYIGEKKAGHIKAHCYLELHVEQGPILETEDISIGAVENLQGISWQELTVDGLANHAGTTPMRLRRDAGHAAARIIAFVHDRARTGTPSVSTVGRISFEPNSINIIPGRAVFTVDMRDPDEGKLRDAEAALSRFIKTVETDHKVSVASRVLGRFQPVQFDENLVRIIKEACATRKLSVMRMTSGAGHDAKPMASVAATAMIFVPSAGGISHNPDESTSEPDLENGANILLDAVTRIAEGG